MTHTLHRLGSINSLKNDYIVLIMKSNETKKKGPMRPRDAFRRVIAMSLFLSPHVRAKTQEALSRFHFVQRFLNRESSVLNSEGISGLTVIGNKDGVADFLKRLKDLDVGSSVVVSGLFSEVDDCLRTIGLCPHTVQYSLGIFGKAELLPSEQILEITTMCGHHLISPRLVEKLVQDVENQKITPRKAARTMAKLCQCGAFNVPRATELVRHLAFARAEKESA
jgi:hypothetical protein